MIDNVIRAATCRVSCGDDSGTGHLVTDRNVLTARHCITAAIESETEIKLTFSGSDGDISLSATIVAQSEEMDACILAVQNPLGRQPIPLVAAMPREGSDWRSFGYPRGKTAIGHRIFGTISHLLEALTLKIDIDLTLDPSTFLNDYRGLSGAAVVSENASRGMIRLKVDGTLGAISIHSLGGFLAENGIQIPQTDVDATVSDESRGRLADRSLFQKSFEQTIDRSPGAYVFLEGAHGIGKTTFCNEFEPMNRELFSLGTYSLASQGRGPGALYRAQPEVFFDWLSTAISALITGKPSRKEKRSYPVLVRDTLSLLEAFSEYCTSTQRHGVLFLDGLNEVQTADSSALVRLLDLLPLSLPQMITIVMTAPNYHNLAALLAGRVKNQNVMSLPPLRDEASLIYCSQELAESRATPALVARICEKAQGHPLYLRYLIEYANDSSEEDALDDFPILTGSIEQYYDSLWPKLLEDADAVNLLAIIARLRWGIEIDDLSKVLTLAEQSVFISTITRIRHLLLNPNTTTIYHPSFKEFLVSKTDFLETVVQKRLSEFCINESGLEYCRLNVVFHLLRSGDGDRSRAVFECNQDWVDECVALGAEPDTLLSDIETTIAAAVNYGPATEVVRLLLLSQRVSFRYNSLFAQSARLIAEALIVLQRPREALKHTIRHNTLIVDTSEGLQISLRLIQHEYVAEAFELLKLLYQRILEGLTSRMDKLELNDFIHLCHARLWTLLFMRLTERGVRMRQIRGIVDNAARMLKSALTEAPSDLLEECIGRIGCVPTIYFLCFRDTYASLAQIKETGEQLPPDFSQRFLQNAVFSLLECENQLEKYSLPKDLESLTRLFSDIEGLVKAGGELKKQLVSVVVDALINLGASSSLVDLVAEKGEKPKPQFIKIKADNGVDVDYSSIHQGATEWRILAFLDADFHCPLVGAFDEASWLSSLDQLICAFSWCEGKARRAKADENESLRLHCLEVLKSRVLQPLAFTLAQRVKWQDSYAIPENAFPFLYERLTLLLIDCYQEELPTFLRDLLDRANDQCGLYSEGLREVMFVVLKKLTTREPNPSFSEEEFRLLRYLKDYTISGVENRHELVPDLLKLIPLFAKLGADEEAERLYRHVLGVSMGPSWYKEDQLGLMLDVLRKIPTSDNVQAKLPLVAGYLERASGEMTFQRFVRYEKHAFVGELFRRGRITNGCRYFKRQTCGTTTELLLESQHGVIDKPSPMVGMRFPGGALDEQHAILEMVRNGEDLDWRLRWALLEIFQFGDERHLDNYAAEYAKLINQAGVDAETISEMIKRIEFVVWAEIEPEKRKRFLKSFGKELNTAYQHSFSRILSQFVTVEPQHEVAVNTPVNAAGVSSTSKGANSLKEDALYSPGVFGRQSAEKEADEALAIAEKHLKLGNVEAGKSHAVKALQILQNGGWPIWGDLSTTSTRAEAILCEGAKSAEELIRAYAPLLDSERHAPKWRLARHLVEKVADLIPEDERRQLLQYAINHVSLIVGAAKSEIAMFSFLLEEPLSDSSSELFRFVLWFLDHPHWLRREKAAGMAAWLVGSDPSFFEETVKEAFSMRPGYSAEILCGVLDDMSRRQPLHLWDRLFALLDLEDVLRDCVHVGRLTVLHRIAERAGNAGSKTGAEVASRIVGKFRSGMIELGTSEVRLDLPVWANCVSREWQALDQLGLVGKELLSHLEAKLNEVCAPLDARAGWDLENAISISFREVRNRPLSRWEAKVRFALSAVLFPYASKRDFQKIELALRVFNPALPEITLTPGFASPAKTVFNAISEKNYVGAIGNAEFFFLNYHELIERDEDRRWTYLEALAVIIPSSTLRRGFFAPSVDASFRSRELPDSSSATTSHETCWHLRPDFAFFGPFTPAFPLQAFTELIGASDSDFFQVSWRNGRTGDVSNYGRPVQEGCLLAVKRKAVRLPSDKKLAWILKVDGKTVTMVDSQNNLLV